MFLVSYILLVLRDGLLGYLFLFSFFHVCSDGMSGVLCACVLTDATAIVESFAKRPLFSGKLESPGSHVV